MQSVMQSDTLCMGISFEVPGSAAPTHTAGASGGSVGRSGRAAEHRDAVAADIDTCQGRSSGDRSRNKSCAILAPCWIPQLTPDPFFPRGGAEVGCEGRSEGYVVSVVSNCIKKCIVVVRRVDDPALLAAKLVPQFRHRG